MLHIRGYSHFLSAVKRGKEVRSKLDLHGISYLVLCVLLVMFCTTSNNDP